MSEWLKHVAKYRQSNPGVSYKIALVEAKKTYKKVNNRKAKVGKGILDRIKSALFFPPNQLPGKSQKVLDENKDAVIQSIMINRFPLSSIVNKAVKMLADGEVEHDKLFHLSMVLTTDKGKFTVEKNGRIDIYKGGSGPGESIDINFSGITLNDFLEKGRKQMGDHNFFQYNGLTNNCQDFLIGLLEGNNTLTSEAKKFIKQDTEKLIKQLPGAAQAIAQFLTDTRGKVQQIISGAGKKYKRKYKQPAK